MNEDDLFYRKMEKELMYDFKRDAIKRGAPNECVELIRQIHCEHHKQVISGETKWRRVKNRGPEPIWWGTFLSVAISGIMYGAFQDSRVIDYAISHKHI